MAITKVKGHAEAVHCERGLATPWTMAGHQQADAAADLGRAANPVENSDGRDAKQT